MKKTKKLIECALLIAIATVLSLIKLVDLPYGGSVTAASMLPIVLIAYRHGLGYGLGSGLVYGVIQQLTGLNTLSWVTTWQSVLAVILLDYVIAFTFCGLGGIFRKTKLQSSASLALGALIACIGRYACHVVSGCTVWAGLSIPDSAALIYSFAYNATYMIPETVVVVIAAYYLASNMDFTKDRPTRRQTERGGVFSLFSGLFVCVALIFDTVSVFSVLQDAESGDFVIKNITSAPWTMIGIVSAVCLAAALILYLIGRKSKQN